MAKFCTYFGNFYAIGHIVIVVNNQTLKNNLAIWSHCSSVYLGPSLTHTHATFKHWSVSLSLSLSNPHAALLLLSTRKHLKQTGDLVWSEVLISEIAFQKLSRFSPKKAQLKRGQGELRKQTSYMFLNVPKYTS